MSAPLWLGPLAMRLKPCLVTSLAMVAVLMKADELVNRVTQPTLMALEKLWGELLSRLGLGPA